MLLALLVKVLRALASAEAMSGCLWPPPQEIQHFWMIRWGCIEAAPAAGHQHVGWPQELAVDPPPSASPEQMSCMGPGLTDQVTG